MSAFFSYDLPSHAVLRPHIGRAWSRLSALHRSTLSHHISR
jgi:hypothetical protein